MSTIPLPNKLKVEELDSKKAVITIEPCYPGYGTTLGNALRRVLLSSLPGAAITAVKFEGAPHEFSSLPYVKEDLIDIILNLKKVRMISYSEEPVVINLKAKGAKAVTAGDLSGNSEIKISNPDLVIATLTDSKAVFNIEVTVQRGRGYLPVEAREKEKLDIGTVAIDAWFSPVATVGMKVDSVRVDQFTNYESLALTVETDGTISPAAAMLESGKILLEQFGFVTGNEDLAAYESKSVDNESAEATAPVKKARKSKKESK